MHGADRKQLGQYQRGHRTRGVLYRKSCDSFFRRSWRDAAIAASASIALAVSSPPAIAADNVHGIAMVQYVCIVDPWRCWSKVHATLGGTGVALPVS